jgi:hypothetical protein
LELTGGEPTCYNGIFEIAACVPKDSEWAITSNTMLKNIERLDISQCIDWTASYHESADTGLFFDNIEYLKKHIPVSVSMVFTKKNWENQITVCMEIKDMGLRVNVIRAFGPDRPDDSMWAEAGQLGGNLIDDVRPEMESGFQCDTGYGYYVIAPDGKVFRCVSDFYYGAPVGKIGEPWTVEKTCHNKCMGCDKDIRHRGAKLVR